MQKKNSFSKKKNFLIVQLPNLSWFLILLASIGLIWWIEAIPWFLFPDSTTSDWWRLLELMIGYVFTILATMFITWGTVSLTLENAMGKQIGKKDEKKSPVTSGAFSYCRHPITLGFIFATPGAFLIFDFLPLLLTTFIFTPVMLLLLKYEEKELVDRFGESYQQYKEKTPWLIPKIGKSNIKD